MENKRTGLKSVDGKSEHGNRAGGEIEQGKREHGKRTRKENGGEKCALENKTRKVLAKRGGEREKIKSKK